MTDINDNDTTDESGVDSSDLLGAYVQRAIEDLNGELVIKSLGHGFIAELTWQYDPTNKCSKRERTGSGGATIKETLDDLEMMAYGCLA